MVHLAAVLLVAGGSVFAPAPARVPLLAAAAATLVPQGIAVLRAFAIYPSKSAVLAAFLRLPLYLSWRCWVLLRTVLGPRQGWRRSARHVEGGAPGR